MVLTEKQINGLNETERQVYEYVVEHKEKVSQMKIRELANHLHLSTTTISRFCKKLGFSGFSELKIKLNLFSMETHAIGEEELHPDFDYLIRLNSQQMKSKVQSLANYIKDSNELIFLGLGTSGHMARYASKYFGMMGTTSQAIDDPYYPYIDKDYTGTVLVVLSRAGATPSILERMAYMKKRGAYIVSLTNTSQTGVAKNSHFVLDYYVPKKEAHLSDVTSQAPTILLLESIAHHLYKLSA